MVGLGAVYAVGRLYLGLHPRFCALDRWELGKERTVPAGLRPYQAEGLQPHQAVLATN